MSQISRSAKGTKLRLLLPDALVYSDGSCSHTGEGGWAALIAKWEPDSTIIRSLISGYEPRTTNNAMEMTAAIRGLSALESPHHVYLVSDSAYLLNTLRFKWYEKWSQRQPEGRPNWNLWLELISLVQIHDVEYIKVKGHASKEKGGDAYNDVVDKEAVRVRKAKGGGAFEVEKL